MIAVASNEPTTVQPLFVNVRTAAAMLGVGLTTAWNLVNSGELPSRRFGRAVRVPVAAIEKIAKAAETCSATS